MFALMVGSEKKSPFQKISSILDIHGERLTDFMPREVYSLHGSQQLMMAQPAFFHPLDFFNGEIKMKAHPLDCC
jgi:hypothetical protein